MKLILPQLAAIIARRDRHNAAAGGRAQSGYCRATDRLFARAVNDDLIGTISILVQLAFHPPAERRTVCIGRGRDESLVPRPDLAPTAGRSARKRRDHA